MSDVKKVLTPVEAPAEIKMLNPSELLQIKGGTGTSQDGIVIEDIIIL